MGNHKHEHCHQHIWAFCQHCNVQYCTVEGCDAERSGYCYPNPWIRPYTPYPNIPYWTWNNNNTGNVSFSSETVCNHRGMVEG